MNMVNGVGRRHILDIAAVLSAAVYLELNLLHFVTQVNASYASYAAFAKLSGVLLFLPLLSLIAQVTGYLNRRAAKAPVVLWVNYDEVEAESGKGQSAWARGSFSSGEALIADELVFGEVAWGAILDQMGSNSAIKLSPYVIIAPDRPITEVEKTAAVRAMRSMGALHAEVAVKPFDVKRPELFGQTRLPANCD